MNKKRALKNMNIEEVSLVDRPANKRKFLLIKREDGEMTELTIKTHGTADGTTLSVNGEKVDDLKAFWFSLWPADEFDDGMINGSYTVSEKDGAEFDRETTFNLKKGMKPMKLEELLKILKVDPETVDQESANRLATLLKFVDMMPPEDATFALNLIKAALMKEETPAEDAGTEDAPVETDDMSPEKVAEIRSAMAQLNGMLPEDQRVVIKAEEPDKLDAILALLGTITKAGKQEGDDPEEEDDAPNSIAAIMKQLIKNDAEVNKRLSKVEKTTGQERVDDDDDLGDDPPEVPLTTEEKLKKYGTKYPKALSEWGYRLQP